MRPKENIVSIKIRLFGFSGSSRVIDLVIHSNATIKEIITSVIKMLNLKVNYDEVLVLCNGRQLYLDDVLPINCMELEFFPLALGG